MFNKFGRGPLTTVEEDFRRIGLLPALTESDDPAKPRDIPSPDPSTLSGLDDSEGDKKAHTPSSKQPKPKMGPAADDAAKSGYDPEEDGGSKGANKGGSGGKTTVAGGKESSVKAESKASYQNAKKGVGPKGKGKNKGQKPALALGLKPVKKLAGMKAEGAFGKAANLIEEVNDLLRGVQTDEEVDSLMRGFRLVAENAALLADRMTEISDRYEVEATVAAMESLSQDAAEALSIIENDIEIGLVGDDEEEASAIAHSAAAEEDIEEEDDGDSKKKVKSDRDPDKEYDVPSPAFKEDAEILFKAMVSSLMDALEMYDTTLDDMGGGDVAAPAESGDIDTFDGGADVDAYEAADDVDADDQGDDDDQGGDDDGDADDQGDDDGGDEGGNDLMSKMRNLRTKKDAMKGGGEKQPPFRGAE